MGCVTSIWKDEFWAFDGTGTTDAVKWFLLPPEAPVSGLSFPRGAVNRDAQFMGVGFDN